MRVGGSHQEFCEFHVSGKYISRNVKQQEPCRGSPFKSKNRQKGTINRNMTSLSGLEIIEKRIVDDVVVDAIVPCVRISAKITARRTIVAGRETTEAIGIVRIVAATEGRVVGT